MLLHVHGENLLGCVFTLTKGAVKENRSQSEAPLLANVCLDVIDHCWSSYGSPWPAHTAVPCLLNLLKQIPASLRPLPGNLGDHVRKTACLALLRAAIINCLLTITLFWTSSSLIRGCQGFRAGQNATACFGSMNSWQLDGNCAWVRLISAVANMPAAIAQSSEFSVDGGTLSFSLHL